MNMQTPTALYPRAERRIDTAPGVTLPIIVQPVIRDALTGLSLGSHPERTGAPIDSAGTRL